MTLRDGRAAHLNIKNKIQVAGIPDQRVARMLVTCGVDYLGFPLGLPVHEEDASEAEVANMIQSLEPPARAVAITYLDKAQDIWRLCQRLGVSIVQLHGTVATSQLAALRSLHPTLAIIKSIIIAENDRTNFELEITEVVDYVDAFLTDTLDAATGARGATGRTHDWNISRAIVDFSPRPVFLAGGLTPDNVRRAIDAVRPAGVDVHTGVEDSTGAKKRDLVEAFVSEARDAFAKI